MVSVRRVQPALSIARTQLASAFAVGLGWWRRRSAGNGELHPGSSRAAQRAGRADLPKVSRAALSNDALHLHDAARRAGDGPADDARSLAALSRRRGGRRARL